MSTPDSASSYADRMHAELERRFSEAGYGTASRVERALDLYRGYFGQHRKAHSLDAGVWLAALENLEIDPFDFLGSALEIDPPRRDPAVPDPAGASTRVASPEARLLLRRHGLDPDEQGKDS